MRLRVSQYAHVHSTDFEFTRRGDGKEFDRIINVCVERATRALDTPARGYSITHSMQDYWKKRYVQYLLDKEETKNLVRFQARFDSGDALQPLMNLANIFGITQGQIMTVDLESSLGCHWRPGPRKKTYHHFPLQGGRLRR
jgi:hypothetical protein